MKSLKKMHPAALLRRLYAILLIIAAVPVVLVVRILRPFVLIRFGTLGSDRLGNYIASTELYLCERDAGMHGKRTFDIFYHVKPISNQQMRKMWDRILHVSYFAVWLRKVNGFFPGHKKHVVPMPSERDVHGLYARTKTHLFFTADEERLGQDELRKLGVPKGGHFVCFHARDRTYLRTAFTDKVWRYHDYRDSNIHNCIPAAEELGRRGYYAVRMGSAVEESLNTTNDKIIDYAAKSRTEFMDIFLGAKCRFFINTSAGIGSIPIAFRRPLAWVNFIPFEHLPSWSRTDVFIPKKMWLRKERRFLTFREILNSRIGRFLDTKLYEQRGIEVIENTPEEILAVVVEMDERLKKTWQTTREDEELQRRFWSLFRTSELNTAFLSHIGAEFLRQNQELLK